MTEELTPYRQACGLVALLGWDWGDALDLVPNETDETLIEFIGILYKPLEKGGLNPFQVDPTPPKSFKESDAGKRDWTNEEKAWRFDTLARAGIQAANTELWKRTR